MIHTVHTSMCSLLGSCSRSVLASQFNVRCSMKATSPNAERGNLNTEPNVNTN
jgi:hypothetical protein